MSTRNIVISVVVAVVVILGGWYVFHRMSTPSSGGTAATSSLGSSGLKGTNTLPVIGNPAAAGDIIVSEPRVGDTISSPVSVSGRALSGWYSEATAPVIVIDVNGVVLGRGSITAQGDWMNATGTVPFMGKINFEGQTSSDGALIFMNDNPSGLPSKAKFYAVPVYFK